MRKVDDSQGDGSGKSLGASPARSSVFQGAGGVWRLTGVVTMPVLISRVSQFLDRPLLDMTGLTGTYQVSLEFVRQSATAGEDGAAPLASTPVASIPRAASGASLIAAMEKQLGLKAEARKPLIDVLVIDSVERTPAVN
jgi:uncharacterized protein (TIGR03435 family)